MKVLGVIPSRYQSSRFPGKPLADIKGKSMICHVWERASQCSAIDQLLVATDDDRIYNEVQSFGGNVVMTAENHTNGTSRCLEAMEKASDDFDVIINIQGDEPLLNPDHLEELIQLFEKPETQIGTLAIQESDFEIISKDTNVKVVFSPQNEALYFSRLPIPHQKENNTYHKHIGIYAYRPDVLRSIVKLPQSPLEKSESLEQLRWLENGYKIAIGVTENPAAISIDTEADLKLLLEKYF